MDDIKNFIAKNVAALFNNGDIVNLGVGIPTLAVEHLPEGVKIIIHSENGIIGCGRKADHQEATMELVDAANVPVTMESFGSCVDSPTSFGAVRGGHIDCTVLGAFQVDVQGNMANWIIPGKTVSGMGGAMDLVAGAKKVIVAMTHTSKNGAPKLLERCTWPLTARGVVTYVVTELAITKVENGEFIVEAMANGITKEELQRRTGAPLKYADIIKTMMD